MEKFSPAFLSTKELILSHWGIIEPMIAGAPVMTDYTPDAILHSALNGEMFVFVVKRDTEEGPDIELVVILAPMITPKLASAVIVTVAGKNLMKNAAKYWGFLKGWMYMNGMRAVDAYVPGKLETVLKRLNFKRESVHVRTLIDP